LSLCRCSSIAREAVGVALVSYDPGQASMQKWIVVGRGSANGEDMELRKVGGRSVETTVDQALIRGLVAPLSIVGHAPPPPRGGPRTTGIFEWLQCAAVHARLGHLIPDLRFASPLRGCVWCRLEFGHAISPSRPPVGRNSVPRLVSEGSRQWSRPRGAIRQEVHKTLCRLNIGDRGRSPLTREVCDSVVSNRLAGESGLLDTRPGPSR
jgi:hypothetical protein